MTNYNERLDEVFETLNNKAREERASCTERNNWEGYNFAYERLESEAKQALTSLMKELVAEAKPKEMDSFYEKPIVDEFEQNLLKALEVNNENK